MLNRTGRLAAVIVIVAGWLFLAIPESAAANRAFKCGDPPPTTAASASQQRDARANRTAVASKTQIGPRSPSSAAAS